jgi:predicted RNase H-like nuclease
VRGTLEASTYEEACSISEAACGKRLRRQSFAILSKISDVDVALRSGMNLPLQVREVHPEVCFAVLNGLRPIEEPKRSYDGYVARRTLLENALECDVDSLRRAVPRHVAADDDILDALAALWTAERIVKGQAITFPTEPERDAYGLRMEMLA